MKKTSAVMLLVFTVISLAGQNVNFKQLAFEAFEKENYPLAINYMQKALEADTTDKEIYYYLGYYIHYNAYDSRPLKGYDLNYSDTVLYYFNKALSLDPNYGDAKYFITAECGAKAFYSLQKQDYENVKTSYKLAYDKGGFPEWSLEYAKLLFDQVESNGILFTHGDFLLNLCWYLQFCEGYRPDVSVIPLAILNRPFFAIELIEGKLIKSVKMGITTDQLMNQHPFKWKETTVEIPIPQPLVNQYQLDSSMMQWTVMPDLKGTRDFLSCERALLLEILESNKWDRPVYWVLGMDNRLLGGLDEFGSFQGLVYKLMPFKTVDTEFATNAEALKQLVDAKNFSQYKSILTTNQPRVSGIVTYGYSKAVIELATFYKAHQQTEKIEELIKFYEDHFMIGISTDYEKEYLEVIKKQLK